MSTGACGIDCSVCRLNLLSECSTCGSGKSIEGAKKRAAQERILGSSCPVLACAIERAVEYCPRDCNDFPCNMFRDNRYPFSEAYLNMQQRRRNYPPPSISPLGQRIEVPKEFWQDLASTDPDVVCKRAGASMQSAGSFLLKFFNSYLLIDTNEEKGYLEVDGRWMMLGQPLTVLMAVVYLLKASEIELKGEMVGVQELKDSHFFQGPHKLKTGSVLMRYGNDLQGLRDAATALGGEPLDLGDLAFKFSVFPKVPVYYLLWKGDEEFPPNLVILFDRTIEDHLAADSIWGIVNLVSDLLVIGQGLAPLIAKP